MQIVHGIRGACPAQTNEEVRAQFDELSSHFKSFHLDVKDTFEDRKDNSVISYANSTTETPVRPYENRYVVVVKTTKH